jgi:hypothetical protein
VIDSLRERERRHHWPWMIGSVVVVWAIWVLPFRFFSSLYQSGAVGIALVVVTGVLLGVGRQGIDVLAVRLIAASMAVLAANPAQCVGPAGCFHAYEIGVVGFGLFGTVLFGLFAIPINVIWNRGLGSLRPEFGWQRLAHLRQWRWIVLWLAIGALIAAFYISLGIPAY